jgi:hypothetical protein
MFSKKMKCLLGMLSLGIPSLMAVAADKHPPHMDLEMTSAEYRALTSGLSTLESDDPLQAILEKGKRNLDWIEVINAARKPGSKLLLSTPETQRGIPITAPSFSNRTIVTTVWAQNIENLPAQMKEVIIDGADFTPVIEVSDEDFLLHARLLDRSYQMAARWLLQEPYLEYYAERSGSDIRGYYHLSNDPDLDQKLFNYRNLPAKEQAQYEGWLLGICRNSEVTLADCRSRLQESLATNGNALPFYRQYSDVSKGQWDAYFAIPVTRNDVVWTASAPNEFVIPFKNPQHPQVLNWLRDNIEDEFRWFDWRLKLDFKDEGDENMTHVEFVPGATPHVNGLAGSKITMDGNRNIDEYSARWTIRHEYGHVLGFPDCYLEFYDLETETMINYQLDITDLMCSRRGAFKVNHFDQLKSAYYTE